MAQATYVFDSDSDASKATEAIGREMGQGGYQGFHCRVEIYDVRDLAKACEICEAYGGSRS